MTISKDGARILGYRLLQELSGSGRSARAEEYVKAGANLSMQDSNGNTALHIAARHGNTKLVKLILEHGANPNIQNNFKFTVLHMAVMGPGGAEMVGALIEHGANGGIKDARGQTPLELVKIYSHKRDVINMLIKERDMRLLLKVTEKSGTEWIEQLRKPEKDGK